MNEINCPHCNKAFKVDEAGYADIVKQVRDSEFDKQLHERQRAQNASTGNPECLHTQEPRHKRTSATVFSRNELLSSHAKSEMHLNRFTVAITIIN